MIGDGLIKDEGYKQCNSFCGEILPLSEFGMSAEGTRRWGACIPCREQILINIKAQASERAEKKRNEGVKRLCLGTESNPACEQYFRSISKFNRLCESCKRKSVRDD